MLRALRGWTRTSYAPLEEGLLLLGRPALEPLKMEGSEISTYRCDWGLVMQGCTLL